MAAPRRERVWPSYDEIPYVTVSNRDPLVETLLRSRARYDALRLKVTVPTGGEDIVDPDVSRDEMLRKVESGLRNTLCTEWTGSACRTFVPGDVTSFDPSAMELWKRFRVTNQHAEVLIRQLSDFVGRIMRSNMPDVPETERPGALLALGQLSSANGWYTIHKDTKFQPPPLAMIAPLFGSAAHRDRSRRTVESRRRNNRVQTR